METPSWVDALLRSMAEDRKTTLQVLKSTSELTNQLTQALASKSSDAPPQNRPITLKPETFGYFNPASIPDAEAAYRFIDAISDGVKVYGETSTRGVLRRCIKGRIAEDWYYGLCQEEKDLMTESSSFWAKYVKRDFMPRTATLEEAAEKEAFSYDQGRSASEYVTKKILLCKIAGYTKEDKQVELIHKGLSKATELYSMMQMCIKDDGNNSLQDYRSKIRKFQDAALANHQSRNPKNNNWQPYHNYKQGQKSTAEQNITANPSQPTDPKKGKGKEPAKDKKDTKKFPRSRKCKNFPTCGDGEHWDAECRLRNSDIPSKSTRAYYASPEDRSSELEERDEDSDLEEHYGHVMQAHFAHQYQLNLDEQEGFIGTVTDTNEPAQNPPTTPPAEAQLGAPQTGTWKLIPNSVAEHQENAFICGKCSEGFKHKKFLHKHLKEKNHYTRDPKEAHQPPTIITSKAVHAHDPEDRIMDFQYMTLNVVFDVEKGETYEVVADTGIGNSAIDANFLQATIPDATIITLNNPRTVRGIGGGTVLVTTLATVPTYLVADNNYLAKLNITYHVFTDLGCNLLIGNDVFLSEKAEVRFAQNHMTLGSCENLKVPIRVTIKERASKVIARVATKTIVPARSIYVLPVKLSKPLEAGQDYLFISKQKAISGQSYGTGVFLHDQNNVMFTNLSHHPITVFKGTAVGSVSSIKPSDVRKVWPEASDELRAFMGVTSDISFDTGGIGGFLPKESIAEQTRPRITPVETSKERKPTEDEPYVRPQWLEEPYHPTYSYPLPKGITQPDPKYSTWDEVHISSTHLTLEQEKALKDLCLKYKIIFNEKMGCVRESQDDWLRVPVSADLERMVKSRPPYPVSKSSRAAIDSQFDDNTAQGRMSKIDRPSPYSMQVFVVRHGTKERPVIDMRMLNELVPGDAYPLPRQEDILANINGMNFISALDITSAFYQRMIHPDDRYRTGIVTHRGHEMFTVSPMGYKRSVQHQQKLMDKAFTGLTWRFVSCFVDDICVYSRTFSEHMIHLNEVFAILANLGITLRASKCFLGFFSLELLGYLVDRMGLTTTEAKTAALLNLPYPETLNKLEYFIGLTNWNRHLVPYYAQRIKPLAQLKTAMLKLAPNGGRSRKAYTTKTRVPKDETLLAAFLDIRDAIGSRPKIFHFQHDRPLYVFLDASPEHGIGIGAYQQKNPSKPANKTNLVPILFVSRELTPAEKNYWPTDMEMSGLVWAVKKMRPYIEQTNAVFYTDHEPSASIFKMTSLATTSLGKSNLRLQNWGIYLSQFRDNITVIYRKGTEMEVPDALSRCRYDISQREQALKEEASNLGKLPDTDEFEVAEAFHGAQEIQESMTSLIADPSWHQAIKKAVQNDQHLKKTYDMLSKSTMEIDGYKIQPMESQYALNTQSQHLFFVDPKDDRLRAVLPTQELQAHALAMAHEGHQGYARTFDKLTRVFYWKRMAKDTKIYVDRCPQCLVNKPRNHRPYGNMQPIISPSEPFNTLTLDLITDLPPCPHRNMSGGPAGEIFDSVMTVTDKFSKAVQFLEGRKDWSAQAWATRFYDRVITNWGYPSTLITDQDKRFIGKFWKELFRRAGTRCLTTTPWHPAGDGQSERTNQSLEITLRFYVDGRQDDWVHHLPVIQGIFNNSASATTGRSPNEVLYGINLRTALDLLNPDTGTVACNTAKELAEYRETIRKEAEDAIAIAQKQMAKYHNATHDEPDFSSGYAYISLKTGYTLPSIKKKKLAAQRMGPYKILESVGKGRALRLQLPPNTKINDVISITNLEPGPRPMDDPYARDLVNIREPLEGAGAAQEPAAGWEIETLLDQRIFGRWKKNQYLVRWKGWTMEYDQWMDESDIPANLIVAYEEKAKNRSAQGESRRGKKA